MTQSRPHIVVIGSSNTDLVVRADRIPAGGETVLGSSYLKAAGGKGANQAVAAARLGAAVTFVGRLGTDAFGDETIEGLTREGIATDFVVRDETSHSGVALIVVDDEGENAIAVAPGANSRLTVRDVDRARGRIAQADVVLLQLETPLSVVQHAARLAHEASVRVILNPAPAQPLPQHFFKHLSVLTPNQTEASQLTGVSLEDPRFAERAAGQLLTAGLNAVVITMGASGVLSADGRSTEHVPPFPVSSVDTTAAGDAFNGALAVALARARRLDAAVRFASAAGALAVTRPGAQPSLPTLSEVEELLDRA